ncbi:redox-sensing transcriptional repressor Rex [bacterium]
MSINKKCIIRLSRYKNALHNFQKLGFVKVFSDNLGDAVGVTAAQVRKDFSLFGITGHRRGGYIIDELVEKLNNILGTNEMQNVIVVGAGNLGTALLNYKRFEKDGIKIIAAFDIDPSKVKKTTDVPVLSLEELSSFIKKNNVKVGIIAVPEIAAQQVFDIMESAGIKGFLNFTPVRFRVQNDDVFINNVNLAIELENVIYYATANLETTTA